MNIESKVRSIAQSPNEKDFNNLIQSIANEHITLQKNICQILFKIFDSEVTKEKADEALIGTAIAIPVELALFHKTKNQNTNDAEKAKVNELIEFISSHFLARSNETHESLRVAMMEFFVHMTDEPLWKKQKVLERFGTNMLNSIFQIYRAHNDKSSTAFCFLSRNLESFLSSSPSLAAMTNSFLHTNMTKYPRDLVVFLTEYQNYLSTKPEISKYFVIHLSFLIRQAFDLNHEHLSFSLLKILIDYIYSFSSNSSDSKALQHFAVLAKIMSQSKQKRGCEVGSVLQNAIQTQKKISCHMFFKNASIQSIISTLAKPLIRKRKSTFETIRPFHKIRLLRSDS